MSGGNSAAASGGRVACFAALFLTARVAGALTMTAGDSRSSLIGPAIGVAALWVGTSRPGGLGRDLAALIATAATAGVLIGQPWTATAVTTLGEVCGALTFVALARRAHGGHLWGLGGRASLARLADLGPLVLGALAGGLAAASAGYLASALGGLDPSMLTALRVWGRGTTGLLVTVALWALVLQPWVAGPPTRRHQAFLAALGLRPWNRAGELAALVLVSLPLAAVVVTADSLDSMTYLLVLPAVWAGLRFPPVVAALYATVLGRAVLVATLVGHGPFGADGQDPADKALLAQGFLTVILLTGLLLALGRSDLRRASAELARAQEEVLARAQLFDTVLRTMSDGLTVLDNRGNVRLSNPASATLLDVSADAGDNSLAQAMAALRHPDGTLVRHEDLPGFRALRGEENPVAVFRVHHADGTATSLQASARELPTPGPDGQRLAVVNLHDVTAEQLHRDTLANFAGTVAHDLCTPLTMINGWAELLVDAFEAGDVESAVGGPAAARIHGSAQHMRDVIRDLLAYTVARDQSLRLTDIDVSRLVAEIVAVREGAEGAPVVVVQPGISVHADRALLRQLFDNLLGNAAKYVCPGQRPQVAVTARNVAGEVEIRVSDNGIGIAPEERESVFEPYHRVGREDRTGRGFGLGLTICKRIVDRHGGRIEVEDTPGLQGTTILLRLPAAADVDGVNATGTGATPADATAAGMRP